MLAKCANPACSTPFLYLRDGKVFRIERRPRPVAVDGRKPPLSVEHFWLCGQCWLNLTLKSDPDGQLLLLPKEAPLVRRAAAS